MDVPRTRPQTRSQARAPAPPQVRVQTSSTTPEARAQTMTKPTPKTSTKSSPKAASTKPRPTATKSKATSTKEATAKPKKASAPSEPTSAPLHVDPHAPHVDGEALVRAEQCIALLQRRLIKPMSRGGPKSELSLTQYHALSFLAARGQASIGELREILGFAQSTTSVLVDKLRRQGLVEKLKDANDQRVACIVPLPKGLRMVQRYRKNAEANLLALRAVLGDGAVRDVFHALERALVATAPLEDPRVARAAAALGGDDGDTDLDSDGDSDSDDDVDDNVDDDVDEDAPASAPPPRKRGFAVGSAAESP